MRQVLIKEVIRKAEQGYSRPYLCRGEDDAFYYVKGRNTDPDSMYKEWICAHLADAFGLPIAEFAIVELDTVLVEALPPELANIGAGPAFGSKAARNPTWLEESAASTIPANLQRQVAAFDWWIQNPDRTKFNSNLLMVADSLVVIDHNNAFDAGFTAEQFLAQHIFADEARELFANYVERDALQTKMQALLPLFDQALAEAPESWKWYDPGATVPANFDPEHCRRVIKNCQRHDFWNMQ